MKTVLLEDLAPEAQQIVEGWLMEEAPINFARVGHLYTEFFDADADISFEMTPEEEEELLEIIKQGKADIAAGRCIPFAEVERLYMEKMRGAAK